MNLLCPNCQKMLTVPEQYAGQLMKCPLCGGTFTVPALPPAAPPPAPEPAPLAPSAPGDVYSLRHDPAPPAPPPAPPLAPPGSAVTTPGPTTPAPSTAPTAPPVGYTRTHTLWFSNRVIQWIPPVCVFLIFILTFFSWVGIYPGGVPAVTQNAWYAAFSGTWVDPDVPERYVPDKKDEPGPSALTIFYILVFLPTLVVTIGVVALQFLKVKLPPAVEKWLPYRWGILALLNLIVFLFLGLQLLLGFSLESTMTARYTEQAKEEASATGKKGTQKEREFAILLGEKLERLQRTFWLRLVVLLHLVTIVSAALMYWLDKRGEGRPLPKLELVY